MFVIVVLSPELRDVFDVDQIGLYADHVAVTPQAARNDRAHVQLLPHFAGIEFPAFVTGDHTTRHNAQLRQLCKAVD
jgi:hypothetical protein